MGNFRGVFAASGRAPAPCLISRRRTAAEGRVRWGWEKKQLLFDVHRMHNNNIPSFLPYRIRQII